MASDTPMPIAIVGMSCRLPGDVSTPGEFWQLLTKCRSGWSKIPKERFNQEAYNHPNPEKKGTINSQGGYFLSQNLEMFDPAFFDMTKKEAETMDPTQRLLLECAYEALENAGIPKETIARKKVGVFIGGPDNEHRMGNLRDLDDSPMFDPTGNQGAFLAGRIAYYFNLRGPTFTVDTACSSSMHALHMAVQSIRSGESDQALVGASHLITQPDVWVSMAKLRLFADSGKTYAFDHRAKSGYARGEGVGCLILKPLDKALADKDYVRAVIAHTGISHNGRTVGIVAPSTEEQTRLVRSVLKQAKINPSEVGFFEAHGTGTKVGDPIEATAIHKALGKSVTKMDPMYMGSVKSNVGHLENASGIISVMKAALMLEKGFVVPNADFERENEAIPLSQWNMKIPTRQMMWPRKKKYVCVNNFGYSGSNGHAVLEAAPAENAEHFFDVGENTDHILSKRLFILSANDEAAVRKSMEKLGIFLEQHAELYQTTMPRNLAYTLCQRRSALSWRVAIVSDMASSLAIALNSPDAVPKRAPSKPPKVAFVFTGQGAQWFGMGRELLKSHPVFLSSIKKSDQHLLSIGSDFSLLEELTRPEKESRVGMAHISQPICSAVQIALVDLFASWGIRPGAVTGHSSGEIGAAYAAGALTLEGAMSAAYYRGQAIVTLKKTHPDVKGAMMAVGAGAQELQPLFKQLRQPLQAVAACENSPSSTTVSGDAEAIDELAKVFAGREIFNRKLFVDVAYHSPHMKLIAKPYHDDISGIRLRETDSTVEFFSSLRGRKISTEELGPQYWVENLTNPVRFAPALQVLCKEFEPDVLIEVGPHAALKGPMMQTLKTLGLPPAKMPAYIPSLVRGRDASETALELAGQLFMRGYEGFDFFNINHNRAEMENPDLIPFLYSYPWSRQKCWYESRITRQHRLKPFARNDLIGTLADWSSDLEPTWRNIIRIEDLPWLRDSVFQKKIVFPASSFLSMVIEAANQRAAMKSVEAADFEIRDFVITEQLFLSEDEGTEMLLNMRPRREAGATGDEFYILSYDSKRGWLDHCRGFVESKSASNANRSLHSKARWQAVSWSEPSVPAANYYLNMNSNGVGYPRAFWNLVSVTTDGQGAIAQGCLQETRLNMPLAYETSFLVHPASLDPMFQVVNSDLGIDGVGAPQLPSAIKHIQVHLSSSWQRMPGSKFLVQSTKDAKSGSFMVELFSSATTDVPSVSMMGLELKAQKVAALEHDKPRELCFKVQWEQTSEPQVNGVSQEHIKMHGKRVVIVTERPQDDALVRSLCKVVESQSGIVPSVSTLSALKDFGGFFIVLSELDGALLASTNKSEFEQIRNMLTRAGGALWVTCGAYKMATNPSTNMALGLLRTVRSELGSSAATLDLDPASRLDAEGQAELIEDAFRRAVLSNHTNAEVEFAEQDSKLVVPRFVVDHDMNMRVQRELGASAPYLQSFNQQGRRLQLATVDPENLYFEDVRDSPSLGQNEVEIQVVASTLGQGDVAASMGEMATPTPERSCSGIVTRVGHNVTNVAVNDKVCMLAESLLGTHARAPSTSVARIPSTMGFGTAALIPSAFCTAYYALAEVARARKAERVLIHVTNEAGLAAVHVSRHLGADTFAVVGGSDKRQEVMRQCGLSPERVLDASSVYFAREVEDATSGCGMDVVFTLSTSAGPEKANVWSCVGPFGRIVEISSSVKMDGVVNNSNNKNPRLAENATFTSINMTRVAAARPRVMEAVLGEVMKRCSEGIFGSFDGGDVTVLPLAEVARGLSMVQSASLMPVVVAPADGEQVMVSHPVSSCKLNPNGTHVIVGGTGGLGRSMAKWMVQHGARHITLLSRSGGKNAKVQQLIDETRDQATIVYRECDIADEKQVRQLVGECGKTIPPICGVVHAAMVLSDGVLEEMSHSSYLEAIRSKVDGTWNLHNVLENANNMHVDYFVLVSSAAGVLGSRGQAAYAAANTFLDAFAAFRNAQGLPAVSLDLTAVTGAGYIAENSERADDIFRNFGGETVSEAEVLGLLSVAVSSSASEDSIPSQCVTGLKLVPGPSGALPYYAEDPRFAHLKAEAMAAAGSGADADGKDVCYRTAFRSAPNDDERQGVASRGILQKLAEVLSVALEDVDSHRSMASYGLDSLTAIEVRNWITRELGANLQILELLTAGSVGELAGLVVSRSKN